MTLDDDLAEALKQRAHERGIPFKKAINETIRAGLQYGARPKAYRVRAKPMGPPRVDLTKALQLAGQLEDEEVVRKLQLGK